MNFSCLPPRNLLLFALLVFPVSANAQVRLNEFMAANDSTAVPNAVAGSFHDWIELYNGGGTPADLSGWHLTDNSANPAKWTFPAGTVIPAGGYRVVFASSNNAPDANGNLHTNFSLSAGGEYLGLNQPDGTVVSEFEAGGQNYPPQEPNVSFGRKPGDLSSVYFVTATPGAANASDGYLRVAPVEASVKRGFYTAPFSVSLITATPAAAVYFTLDSSPPLQANGTPAAGATLYSVPIQISTTTVLRSAAVRSGYEPAAVDSQSYIFPASVATQVRPGTYPTLWGGSNAADYAVDPAVSQSVADQARFQAGLRALPTLSVSTTVASLFGPSGIYTQSTNDLLEAAVSAEYFKPAASGDGVNVEAGFQIDCGLKVQGGSSRNYASSAKHSFSLRFRAEYGAGKLNYDLFGAPAVDSFNSVQLRAMYNNSWTHSDANQRARATMIRDQWMRDSLIAMGQPGGHGKYVNLYLNGLFWGVYNLHERLDNDHYAAYEEGVAADSVFSYNPGSFTTAEQTSLNLLRSAVTGGDWANIEARLDVDSYVDYYIMQHFGHNDDLKTDGNWRAAGGGPGNHKWRFYLWDSERTMENPTNVAALAVSQDGVNIITGLDHLPGFQTRFADRAWKHLTHGGALVNPRNRERYSARVTELDDAITGESARWGDWRTTGGGGPAGDYTRTENWLRALNGPLSTVPTGGVLGTSNSWYPASGTTHRTNTILTAWKTQTWPGTTVTKLPSVDPPAFTVNHTPQHGGVIPAGGVLRLTGGTGTLYVTTDGSDPRQTSGAVQAGLAAYSPGSPIPLTSSSTVRARWFNGTRWSALNEADFFVEPLAAAGDALRISEIHYHPASASPQEILTGAALSPPRSFAADDFQFLEILNHGATSINLAGSMLSGGVSYTFGNTPLAPGARVVVAENAAAFNVRYGPGMAPSGIWNGALARNGEALVLLDGSGATITSVTYSDNAPWPGRADGDGSSLELADPSGWPDDPQNWRSSFTYHGSPGSAGPVTDGPVLINEILAHTDPPLLDSIELVNPTAAPVDVSGWFLSDSKTNYRKFRIPAGTVIAAGGYAVFDADQFNSPESRAISGFSGTPAAAPVTVTSPDHGLATGDVVTLSGYGGFGRYQGTFQVIVTGANTFTLPVVFLDDAPVKGTWTSGEPFALNASSGEDVWLVQGAAGGELKLFSDHLAFPASLNGESFGRWPDASGRLTPMLTLTLGAANSAPRVGPLVVSEIMIQPDNSPETNFEFVEIWNPGSSAQSLANWTLRGDVDFNFTSQSVPANGRLVVVGFDPADAPKRDAFLTKWAVSSPVLAGPWTAGDTLGNAAGTVRLRRADTPPAEDPEHYPQVIEDEVFYSTDSPWPLPAGPGTQSLHRTGPAAFGSNASSWQAAPATPGYPAPAAGGGYESWITTHNITGGANGDSENDGVPNLVEYALGLNPALSDIHLLPQPVLEGNILTFTFQKPSSRNDVTTVVQMSANLSDWSPLPDSLVSESNGIETRRVTIPASMPGPVFVRLRVSR
jgi:hypothetical protein